MKDFRIPWWSRIKIRVLVFGIIMSIVPVALSSGYTVFFGLNHLEKNVQNQNKLLVDRIVQEMDSLLIRTEERLRDALFAIETGNKDNLEKMNIYRILRDLPMAEEAVIFEPNGTVRSTVNRFHVVNIKLEQGWAFDPMISTLKAGKVFYGPVNFSESGVPYIKMAVPRFSEDGRDFKGGIGVQIRLRSLFDLVGSKPPGVGENVFLVDRSGKLIAHNDHTQVLQRTNVTSSFTVQHFLYTNDPNKLPAPNRYQSYSGQEVLGVYGKVSRTGWGVVVEQPVSVAFSSIKDLLLRLLWFLALAVSLVVMVSIFFGLQFTKPIEYMEKAVQKVGGGALDTQIATGRRDELGSLMNAFDEMTAQLRVQLAEQRKMEEMVMQADKLSALGMMASGFAHEINNPLATIQVYTEDLEDRLQAEPEEVVNSGEASRYLRIIKENIARSKQITQSLLNFSRKSEWKQEWINPVTVIEESLALLNHSFEKKGLQIRKEWDPDLPRISGDSLQLMQVLVNLLNNAVDALSVNGTIGIQAYPSGDQLVIRVYDNGSGIPKEYLTKIFDPFFTTKEIGKGTGLGLSICYGIVSRMGGTISIQSEEGNGTEVTLSLPIDATQKGGA